jgi:uncharacterized protein YeaO (DUF488 family)
MSKTSGGQIYLRRAYEPPSPHDGQRILVDRVWPRGVRKEEAQLSSWQRDVAPSNELRRWFGHDPARWDEFRQRYRAELDAHPDVLQPILDAIKKGDVTLVYGARDEEHNQAVALKQFLDERLGRAA